MSFQGYNTPRSEFDPWNAEFGFTLDAAADHDNALARIYCTKEGTFRKFSSPQEAGAYDYDDRVGPEDGLNFDWAGHRVFCNPPYAGNQLHKWVGKAAERKAEIAILLLPASVDTQWFHDLILPRSGVTVTYACGWREQWRGIAGAHDEVLFRRGRIKFIDPRNPAKNSPSGGNLLWIVRHRDWRRSRQAHQVYVLRRGHPLGAPSVGGGQVSSLQGL